MATKWNVMFVNRIKWSKIRLYIEKKSLVSNRHVDFFDINNTYLSMSAADAKACILTSFFLVFFFWKKIKIVSVCSKMSSFSIYNLSKFYCFVCIYETILVRPKELIIIDDVSNNYILSTSSIIYHLLIVYNL